MSDYGQVSLFDCIYEKYQITKPIRLIELFAGYGSQALAFQFLGANFEHYKICEFDKYAVETYNAFHKTSFETSDITKLKASDLEIVDKDKFTYIMTYSFPCTDLSLAGKRAGMEKGNNTRSGLLWEVERLLTELGNNLPQVLVMENVPQVIKAKGWHDWCAFLENLGYSNYCELLNSKDYYIPQNRERAFMVSILGEYSYKFPKALKLDYLLRDFLEDNVDEKYYLSEKKIKQISNWKAQQDPLKDIEKEKLICPTLTARCAGEEHSGMILINEATTKGYAIAQEGDGVYINRPHQKRGVVQKSMIQTLKTSPDVGVVVKVGNYSPSGHNASTIVDVNGIAPTVMENHGTVTAIVENNRFFKQAFETLKMQNCEEGDTINAYNKTVDESGICPTLTTRPEGFKTAILPITKDLRIRKLTPSECYCLMGVPDRINKLTNVSNSQQYKQAGNSIVTTCLMGIFGELLGIDYISKIKELVNQIVES